MLQYLCFFFFFSSLEIQYLCLKQRILHPLNTHLISEILEYYFKSVYSVV